jgi:hypothetical protein
MRRREAATEKKKLRRFVRRKKVLDSAGHWVTNLESPWDGLRIIADHLNSLPELQNEIGESDCPSFLKDECTAWTLVETIVSACSLSERSELFTAQAKNHSVNMVVEMREELPHPVVTTRDTVGTALWHLWLFYFRDHGWDRLRRCSVCRNWFVDQSKNRCMLRCSLTCTWRWWNRVRREQAQSVKKGATKHGTKARR